MSEELDLERSCPGAEPAGRLRECFEGLLGEDDLDSEWTATWDLSMPRGENVGGSVERELETMLEAYVRFALECAALSVWLTGQCEERLIAAAEASDRGDFRSSHDMTRAVGGIVGGGPADFAIEHAADAAGFAAKAAATRVAHGALSVACSNGVLLSAESAAGAAVGVTGRAAGSSDDAVRAVRRQCELRARELGLEFERAGGSP